MQKFEYMIVDPGIAGSPATDAAVLNQWAAQGWRFVTVSTFGPSRWFYFERAVTTTHAMQAGG